MLRMHKDAPALTIHNASFRDLSLLQVMTFLVFDVSWLSAQVWQSHKNSTFCSRDCMRM